MTQRPQPEPAPAEAGDPRTAPVEPSPGPAFVPAPRRPAWAALSALAAGGFALFYLPLFLGYGYGYHIDELYYIACARRLAWGFVDHPPLAPALLAPVVGLLGDSLAAIRLLPALAGAATMLLTGWAAARLGAGRWGQLVAAGAVLTVPVFQVLFGVFSVNAFEFLLWTGCLAILIEIELRGEPRLWLAFGALAGLALLNKHTTAVLAVGLAAGLLLTSARRHLTGRWLWLGAGVAALIFLPNLLWQIAHDWPSLEFYRNAAAEKNLPTPPLGVLVHQLRFFGPTTVPLWGAGLFALLAGRLGRSLRHLGWLYLTLLVLLAVSQQARPDRIAGVYPILFAAGAAYLEPRLLGSGGGSPGRRWPGGRWLAVALPALIALGGLLTLPPTNPVLPPAVTARYAGALGMVPQIESGAGKTSELPQWLADRFGWEELVADVAAVVERLPPGERERAVIVANSYGHAGALELWGDRYDLPPVYSTHNNYVLWGPPPEGTTVAVVLGDSEERLRELFEEVEHAAVHDCDWCMRWRDELPIRVVRGPRIDFQSRWYDLRHFE